MKIAYIANQANCISGASNGIRMQALMWKEALEKKGNTVDLINAWGNYNWKEYDVIHIFGGGAVLDFIPSLFNRNENIFLSPIIDTDQSYFKYKLASFWGCERLRLVSSNYKLRLVKNKIKRFLTRTKYENFFLTNSYGVPQDKVDIVPLSFRNNLDNEKVNVKKEDFCLHVSSFTQSRKNVMRLIDAAIKYKFKLIIAGSYGSEKAFEPFKKKIEENKNIEYVGFATDDMLNDLYARAKVFALPSTYEGVGLVALEAAVAGDEIVITNVGGPKEYYANLAFFVNPYSIDEIGKAVLMAMHGGNQPQLSKNIVKNYNLDICVKKLIDCYKK